MVGRIGCGVWVGTGLGFGKWQFSSNFLFAFANLLLGVVASISGSIFFLSFLGVGNLGLAIGGNGFRVGNFYNACPQSNYVLTSKYRHKWILRFPVCVQGSILSVSGRKLLGNLMSLLQMKAK